MEAIIEEIFQGNSFSDDEVAILYSKLHRSEISKGEFLLRADDPVGDMYYVHSGCLRSYVIDLEGKEHTLQFAVKGWWISDYIALYGRGAKTSVSYVECINAGTLYRVSKVEFDHLCRDIPKLAQLHIRKMELAFASFQKRILENLTLAAKKRYTNFVAAYPSIANDVKNYHIASYLGITTESLSRIRKELATS